MWTWLSARPFADVSTATLLAPHSHTSTRTHTLRAGCSSVRDTIPEQIVRNCPRPCSACLLAPRGIEKRPRSRRRFALVQLHRATRTPRGVHIAMAAVPPAVAVLARQSGRSRVSDPYLPVLPRSRRRGIACLPSPALPSASHHQTSKLQGVSQPHAGARAVCSAPAPMQNTHALAAIVSTVAARLRQLRFWAANLQPALLGHCGRAVKAVDC